MAERKMGGVRRPPPEEAAAAAATTRGSSTSMSSSSATGGASGKSSWSPPASYADADDCTPGGAGTVSAKPHRGNDRHWEALRRAEARDGGLRLGSFKLLKKLGFGDIGSVYLAELIGSGCLFAIKVMDKEALAARKKLLRAQMEREILSMLDHPFLPTLYSHFETEKFSCLVMEFCSGGDLHTLRQRQPGKHFTEQAARFYASEILLALEYLHMMGVVYRDLKPENVLVREDGHIMLTDFDLSMKCAVCPTVVRSAPFGAEASGKIAAACKLPVCIEPTCLQPSCFAPLRKTTKARIECISLTHSDSLPELVAEPTGARSMSFVGTHEYLAPEIIRGDGHGSAVDWWTLGIFLYELLHGKTPFKGEGNRATLFNVIGQCLKFPDSPAVSFSAKDLIKGLLIKDPQQRLGYRRGAAEVKQHPFFANVNWALIRSTLPPEIPKPVTLSSGSHHSVSSCSPPPPAEHKASDSDNSSESYLDFEFF